MRVCEGQGVEMCNGHELATTHPSLHTACPYQAACHGVRIRIRYLRAGGAYGGEGLLRLLRPCWIVRGL